MDTLEKEPAVETKKDRFRKLIEGLNVVTYEFDLLSEKFIYISKMAEVILGYPSEMWTRKGFWIKHLHPQDKTWAPEFSKIQTRCKKDHEFEYRMIAADGTVKWFKDITTVHLVGGLPKTLQGVMIDITERKNTENELKGSKEKNQALVEQQTEMITRWKPDGTFTFVNDVYCMYFEKRKEQLIGKSYIPQMPVEDLERFSGFLKQLDINNPVGNFTHRVITPDGDIRWLRWTDTAIFDTEGNITEYQTVGRDITSRKKAEEALRDSEQQLLMIFDNAPIGMAITDFYKNYIKVNKAYCDIVGYSKQELMNMSIEDITHIDDKPYDEEILKKSLSGDSLNQQFEKRFIHKCGKIVFVEQHLNTIKDSRGKPVQQIAQIINITERKESEKKLKLTQARLSAILNNLPNVAIYEYGEGINFVSENIYDILGFNADEFMYNDNLFGSLMLKDDIKDYDRKVFEWKKNGANGVVSSEIRVKNKKGDIVWLEDHMFEITDDSGKSYFSGIMIDITQHKKTQKKIEETETRLAAILKNLPKIVVYQSGSNKEFISDNIEEMTGFTPAEVLKEKYFFGRIIHPDDMSVVKKSLAKWNKNKQVGNLNLEFRIKRKNGDYIWLEDHMFRVKSDDGTSYLSGVLIDVTERKITEQKISQSLHEKELLLKEIHHRVKNNLQVVSSLLKLQSGYIRDDEKTINVLLDSQNRVRSMALVHQKLYQSKDFSQIDFSEYLKQLSLHLLNVFKNKSDSIDIQVKSDKVNLSIDLAVPCGLIINELLSNSLKYAFPDTDTGNINVKLSSAPDNEITLIISDNGVGFPKEIDFKDTHSLGLQLVNTLVGQIDGSIAMQNHLGTSFIIKFRKKEPKFKN